MRKYYIPPESFYIGSLEIRFYGVIIALSMLIGILVACKLAKKHKVKSDDIFLLAILVLPCAVVGARLYYCIFYDYVYSFGELFNIKQGGLAIYGGVIGGIIGIVLFCVIKKDFNILPIMLDICAPALILGQSIGRWGNFFNQECYGNLILNTDWQWFPYGVFIESEGAWHQATFFYESFWNMAGFAILLFMFYQTKCKLSTTGMYLVWYGAGRAVIEGLRQDSLYISNTHIRVSQALSICLVVIGLVILAINIAKRVRDGKKV